MPGCRGCICLHRHRGHTLQMRWLVLQKLGNPPKSVTSGFTLGARRPSFGLSPGFCTCPYHSTSPFHVLNCSTASHPLACDSPQGPQLQPQSKQFFSQSNSSVHPHQSSQMTKSEVPGLEMVKMFKTKRCFQLDPNKKRWCSWMLMFIPPVIWVISRFKNTVTTSVRCRLGDGITQSQDDDGNVRNCSNFHFFFSGKTIWCKSVGKVTSKVEI